jgi:hypothetical protein
LLVFFLCFLSLFFLLLVPSLGLGFFTQHYCLL